MWKSDDEESNLLSSVVTWASATPTPQPSSSLNSYSVADCHQSGNTNRSQQPPFPPPSPFSELFPQELLQSSGLLLNQFDDDSASGATTDRVSETTTENGKSRASTSVHRDSTKIVSNPSSLVNSASPSAAGYRCTECKFWTDDRGKFVRHGRSKHSAKKTFTCPDCSAKFTRQYSLKTHRSRKHPTASTSVSSQILKYCSLPSCKFATRNPVSMQLHKRSHQRFYFCKECNSRYTNRQSLLGHLTKHHGSNAALIGMGSSPSLGVVVDEPSLQSPPPLAIDADNSGQEGLTDPSTHVKTEKDNEPATSVSTISTITDSHTGADSSGRCAQAVENDQGASSIDDVIGSVAANSGLLSPSEPDTKFVCDKCPYLANSLRRLYAHKLSSHRNAEKMIPKSSHICPQCPRKFASLKRMLTHVKKIHSVTAGAKQAKQAPRTAGKRRQQQKRPQPVSMVCDRCHFSTSRKRVFTAHLKSHHVGQNGKMDCQQRKPNGSINKRITPDRPLVLPPDQSPSHLSTSSQANDVVPVATRTASERSSIHSNGSLHDCVRGLFGQYCIMNETSGPSTPDHNRPNNPPLFRLDLSNQTSAGGLDEMSVCLQGLQQANGALMQLLRRRENELRTSRSNMVELLRLLFPHNQALHNVLTLENVDDTVADGLNRIFTEYTTTMENK